MPTLPIIALGLIIFIGLTLFVAITLRRVVPTNMVNIVQSGKKTTNFGKDLPAGNVYYEIPAMIPLFGVNVIKLPVSNFDVPLDNYPAYDYGRLPFMVDVRAFFVISDTDKAAKRVSSFDDLRRQLTEILRGSVRSVLAQHPLEEILGSRAELAKMFTAQVDEQLAEYGVQTIKSIEFMDMKDKEGGDSTVIHDIMAKDKARISRESRVAIAENTRHAEIAEIEARQLADVRRQEAQQLVGQRTAEQEKQVGIAREKSRQETLAEARVTAERDMEVKRVTEVTQAEIDKKVAEVTADQDKNVAVVRAEAEQQMMVINAEGEKQRLTLVAEGSLSQALKDAEGITARGEAEGKAKTAINLAAVTPQITLAKEIGANKEYQEYLVNVEQIKANMNVGVANAGALKEADIKIIANGGDVVSGMGSVGEIFSSKGGTAVAGWLTSLAQTPEGEALLKRIGIAQSSDTPAPIPTLRPSPGRNGRERPTT